MTIPPLLPISGLPFIAGEDLDGNDLTIVVKDGTTCAIPTGEFRKYVLGFGLISAGDSDFEGAGPNNWQRIQAAIDYADSIGSPRVLVPLSMLPYDASLITFSNAVQMVREGGDYSTYDVYAYGATGDGIAQDRYALLAAINGAAGGGVGNVVTIPSGTYLVGQPVVSVPTIIKGHGTFKQDTVDKEILDFWDQTATTQRIKGWDLYFCDFGPQPHSSTDNFGALQWYNGEAPVAAFCSFDDVDSMIRCGYDISTGLATRDALILGCYGKNAKVMGVENIQADYTTIIGFRIHNDGTQHGIHGIRWSGVNEGGILSSSIIRDRGTCGVSMQDDARNVITSAAYIQNCLQGIQINSSIETPGGHVISGTIVRDAGVDSINIAKSPNCMIDALSDGATGGFGLRTGSSADDTGGHLVRLLVRDGQAFASIRGNGGIYEIVGDGATATEPLSVSGSNNVVICSLRGGGSNALYVTGNDNTIIVNETANSTVGMRVDGLRNQIFGKISGNVTMVGDSNLLQGYFAGNVTLNAGADNNKINGNIAGTITNSGAGNDLSGIYAGDGVSPDVGDAAYTITPRTGYKTIVYNTPITAARAVTLTNTAATRYNSGVRYRIVRTAACTGAFNVNVGTGPLKALATAGTWCDVEQQQGGVWMLTAYGAL